jgi:putative flippase GtrA
MVGVSNTLVAYAVYSVLVYIHIYYILANVSAFVISVLNSFYWNNKYVFKSEGKYRSIIISLLKTFFVYSFTGLVLSNILLFLLVDVMRISKYIAPFFGLFITVPLNFFLNKFWTFRPGNAGTTKAVPAFLQEDPGGEYREKNC